MDSSDIREGTHGTETMLYSTPILVPISWVPLILATQGVTTLTKAPDRNPYTAANTKTSVCVDANSHKVKHEIPEKKAEGKRRLKCPRISEMYAGAILPSIPKAFIVART